MSKKNSREAKLLRKEKYAKKRAKWNDPCPQPEDYGKHWGYIPNEPYFQNAAYCWNERDMRFAIRSKEQLVEYANREETKWLGSRSGVEMNYVSVFHTGGKSKDLLSEKNLYFEVEDFDYSIQKYYYLMRDLDAFSATIGEKRTNKSDNEWKVNNPFYNSLNTFCLTKKDIENLPSVRSNFEEITELAKLDEKYNAMTEEELDNLIADIPEVNLRKHYVYEEGGLVIDEFKGETGITLYQPRKREETWKRVGISIPFHLPKSGGLGMAKLETQNINHPETNNS